MSKHKHLETAVITAIMFINIGIIESVQADDSGKREWTKERVAYIIGGSIYEDPWDHVIKDQKELDDAVDFAYPSLFELLDEAFASLSTRSTPHYSFVISHVFGTLSYTKNNHDLFAKEISNRLETFQGSPEDLKDLKRDAARALERMRQSRENANKDTPNLVQAQPPPKITDAPQPEPPTPATTNETTQANQDTSPAQPEKTSSNKTILWLAVAALLAIIGGVAVWRKK